MYSVIVTYHPNISHVMEMCKALIDAGVGVVIFDNTPDCITSNQIISSVSEVFRDGANIDVIGSGVNFGLSVAFNRSVKHALDTHEDIEGFLFFDQDSTLTSENLSALIREYYQLKDKNTPVGVFGALPVDDKGTPYRVRKSKFECIGANNENYFCADFVISSFSLVPRTTFEKVGFFDEKLFIDLVDSEFSFRCSKYGLLNIVSKNVQFPHVIGDKRGTVLGRSFAISSPIRNYYQARNLILVGRDYGWYYFIFSKVLKRFIQIILSSFYDHKFLLRIQFFIKGVYDGILYKGGPYDRK